MSKAKTPARRAVAVPYDDGVDLPPDWRRRPWIPVTLSGVVVVALLAGGLAVNEALRAPRPAALAGCTTSTQIAPTQFTGRQPICISSAHNYQATINTTQGEVVIQLYPQIAPVTVNNFIVLALDGYYDNMPWQSQDWVVQSGDANGDGRGGPGYALPEEPNKAPDWGIGAVGMARPPGGPVSGSQFFIQRAAWPGTGPTMIYNRFGTVVKGMDKVELLTSPSDKITSITIEVG